MMNMQAVPLVSVVIPVRNEEAFIHQGITAALNQDYPPEKLEVLVADGRSEDGTQDIVRELQWTYTNLRLVDNPDRITSGGLNAGIRQARGDVIIIVGGHAEMAHDYVQASVQALREWEADAVGGVIETVGETTEARAIALAMSSRFGVGGVSFRTGKAQAGPADTVVFGAYRKEAIALAGLFNTELVRNQDDEFNYRLRKLGGRLVFSPTIRARYYSRSSLRATWRQYFQYGYWKVRVLQKHPQQMSWRQFAPPALALAVIISLMLALAVPGGWIALLFVAGSYMGSNLLASLLLARANGWQYLRFLPSAFASLHLSYGFGFWWGAIRFFRHWLEMVSGIRQAKVLRPIEETPELTK
jgi:succinoglycan biosynthesis protein ExoA